MQSSHDALCKSAQGQNFIGRADRTGFLWHTKDHAARFVLCKVVGAGLLHGQHTQCAVFAHAGENHANRVLASKFGAGKKVVIFGLGTSLQPGLVIGSAAYCLIYMDGVINCASEGAITNNSWAGGLQVFSWTTSTCNLGHKAQTMACVMAPFAPILFTGGSTTGSFVGSIIGKTVTVTGHMDFHYDEALGSLGSIGSIGSMGTPGTTATSALVGITRTKWSEVKSRIDLANLGTLTGNFLP